MLQRAIQDAEQSKEAMKGLAEKIPADRNQGSGILALEDWKLAQQEKVISPNQCPGVFSISSPLPFLCL